MMEWEQLLWHNTITPAWSIRVNSQAHLSVCLSVCLPLLYRSHPMLSDSYLNCFFFSSGRIIGGICHMLHVCVCAFLKEIGPLDNYFFWRPIQLNQVPYVLAPLVFKVLIFECYVEEKINNKIVLASIKTLTNFKDWSVSRVRLLFPATLDARKIRENLHVLVGFRYNFSVPLAGVFL